MWEHTSLAEEEAGFPPDSRTTAARSRLETGTRVGKGWPMNVRGLRDQVFLQAAVTRLGGLTSEVDKVEDAHIARPSDR